jgi:hypothetical protein
MLRALLPAGSVAMEFCWLYPWLLLFTGAFYGPGTSPLLSGGAAFVVLAAGFAAVRAALARPWALSTARAMVVGAGLAVGLGAVKTAYYPSSPAWDLRWVVALARAAHDALPVVTPAVMASLLAALLWWRGVILGERDFTHFEIERAFRRGVAWTIFFVVLFAIYGDSRGFATAASAPAYLLGFFSLGLIMLAVTRLLAIWQESQADDAQALAANRHWLLLLVAVVGLILTGASLFSGAVSLQFRPGILRILAPLAPVVEFLFLIAFSVALVIARAIIYVLSQFPRRFSPADRPPDAARPLGNSCASCHRVWWRPPAGGWWRSSSGCSSCSSLSPWSAAAAVRGSRETTSGSRCGPPRCCWRAWARHGATCGLGCGRPGASRKRSRWEPSARSTVNCCGSARRSVSAGIRPRRPMNTAPGYPRDCPTGRTRSRP